VSINKAKKGKKKKKKNSVTALEKYSLPGTCHNECRWYIVKAKEKYFKTKYRPVDILCT
jgi:hypothetical protein